MTTVQWQGWNARGQRPGAFSAVHLTTDGGKTTLCGITPKDVFDIGSGWGGVTCSKCARRDRR